MSELDERNKKRCVVGVPGTVPEVGVSGDVKAAVPKTILGTTAGAPPLLLNQDQDVTAEMKIQQNEFRSLGNEAGPSLLTAFERQFRLGKVQKPDAFDKEWKVEININECGNVQYHNDEKVLLWEEKFDAIPRFRPNAAIDNQLVRYRGFVVDKASQPEYFCGYSKASSSQSIRDGQCVEIIDSIEDSRMDSEMSSNETKALRQDPVVLHKFQDAEVPYVPGSPLWERTACMAVSIPYESSWTYKSTYGTASKRQHETAIQGESVDAITSGRALGTKVWLLWPEDSEEELKVMIHSVVDVLAFVSVADTIPRLHIVKLIDITNCSKLPFDFKHPNTLLNQNILKQNMVSQNVMENIRKDLKTQLRDCLGGDDVVAEYLLLGLVATNYGGECFGLTPLNFIQPAQSPRPRLSLGKLLEFLKSIHPHVFSLDVDRDRLHSDQYWGCKDPATDERVAGTLEIVPGSLLVVNENMSVGKLEEKAVRNVETMKKVLQHKKVHIDFQYYQIDYNCAVQGMVFSEGRSIFLQHGEKALPIYFGDDNDIVNYMEVEQMEVEGEEQTGSTSRLALFRHYIQYCRERQGKTDAYDITAELQEHMAKRYAEFKSEFRSGEGSSKIFPEDMIYCWCDLFRVLAFSKGIANPDIELWKEFEATQRKSLERFQKFSK